MNPFRSPVFRRLLGYLRPYRGRLVLAVLLMAVSGGFAALGAYMIKPVLDQIFIARDARMLVYLPLGVLGIYLVKGLADYAQNMIMAGIEERILLQLKEALYSHTLRLPLETHLRVKRGEVLSRMSLDLTLLQSGLSVLASFFLSGFTIIALMGVVLYQNWQLALVSFLTLPLALYPLIRFGESLRRRGGSQQQHMGQLLDHFAQTLDGIEVIKVHRVEDFEQRRFAGHAQRYFTTMMHIWRVQKATLPFMEFVGALGIAIIIFLGGRSVIQGEMSTGAFFSFLTALIMVYEPLRRLSAANNQLQQGLSAADRLFAWIDQPAEALASGGPALQWQDWHCEHLSLRYPGAAEWSLVDLNLSFMPGETVAITGASGSGKTSFARVLLGLVPPSSGHIRLGRATLDPATLPRYRQLFAFVGQDPVLFEGSALFNIAYGDAAPDRERARRAAEQAHAWEFLEPLGGLEAPVGPRGGSLSGGQKQRLAIARALYRDAPVLVLDEATSALDADSEEKIAQTIAALHGQKSIFIIAHRPRTVRLADRVLRFDGGRALEEGAAKGLSAEG
ncbi:MAG: ABC transporter ATP-binding protein [Pseudomonadota bacterium]|uniref:ABC transporter ATP-binding protein n=1 Tax=Thermithiobacillus tepidarius TaxID=929 RepID=UPI00041E7D8E|nr:ABC transporter ATP-binding protein [Thermithiobacillus tepidarius]